jgi:hypothetical protein
MPPYFNDRRRGKKRFFARLKIFGVSALAVVFLFAGAYFLFCSDFLKIKEIKSEFSGGSAIPELTEGLKKFFVSRAGFWGRLGGDSIFIWKNGELPEIFLAEYPKAEKIFISKDYWDRAVLIEVKERERFGVWCSRGKCFWFDKNGIAFEEAPETEGGLIRKAEDFSEKNIKEGDSVLEGGFAGNFIKIFGVLENAGISASLRLENKELQEIIAVPLEDGFPKIYFSLRVDPAFGLAALRQIQEQENMANLSYIDLRVENRAYYK